MIRRLKRSLLTWPDAHGGVQCFLIGALSLLLIGIVAGLGGLLTWQPRLDGWLLRLISALCVPAFTEELIFRGLLIPDRGEVHHPIIWMTFAILLFVVWHVFEALVLLSGARLFLRPIFLLCAAILGTGCALMRYRTGSIWPAVILHGLLVWAWQVFFGGPDIAQLLR
ncbi:type II CAAX prenyl endopeptidase Rce1 family protein [Asticcacaulis sp.]|uniref:CPBP family glutamic-type intramembrane protease n=1 Tax=Asticcacaulis sp. TaxID=1872648 RepID=UPI002C45860F|nr:CPBP family glutamic-type intramembrane protease [Asticcacaulis sp.]HTM81283.1 CPBP family glutamic-type intramembrane protease [Asticcacaulis sp.]